MATTVTVRPNVSSTYKSGTWTATGAANGQTALSDNSDSSYIKKTSSGSGSLVYGCGTPTLPGSSAWYRVRARVRVNMPNDSANISVRIGVILGAAAVYWSSSWTTTGNSGGIVTLTGPWATGNAAETLMRYPDMALIELKDNTSQTANASTWYEAYIDYEAIALPTVTITAPPASVTDTTRPAMVYDWSQADGYSPQSAQVVIQNSAQFNNNATEPAFNRYDPDFPVTVSANGLNGGGTTLSDTYTPSVDLPVGQLLYYRVRAVMQRPSGGYISNAYQGTTSSFTINTAPPANPDMHAGYSSRLAATQVDVLGHTNLLSSDNASAESTVGDWVNDTNAQTPVRSTAQFSSGVASVDWRSSAGGTVRIKLSNTGAPAVLPSCDCYTVTAKLRSSVARTARVGIRWLTSAYATISDSYGLTATTSTSAWTTYTVTAAPPSNAAFAVPLLEAQGTLNTDVLYADEIGLLPNPALSTANRLWNPSFEVNTDGWAATAAGYTAGTVAVSGTRAQVGSSSGLWTLPTAGAAGTVLACMQADWLVPGRSYTFSCYVWVTTGVPNIEVVDLFGTTTGNSSVVGSTSTKQAWVRLDLSFTATATTHFLGVRNVGASTSGQQVWVDSAQLQEGALSAYTAPGTYTWSPGGWADHRVTIERSYDGGTTWAPVFGGEDVVMDGAQRATLYDYGTPRGVVSADAQYRATHYATALVSGLPIASTQQTDTTTATNDGLWWWQAPRDPSLTMSNVRVLAELEAEELPEQVGVFRPLGSTAAVVVGGTVQGPDGALRIYAAGTTEQDAVQALVEYADVTVLKDPFGDTRWVRVTDRNVSRAGTGPNPRKLFGVQYVTVDELVV